MGVRWCPRPLVSVVAIIALLSILYGESADAVSVHEFVDDEVVHEGTARTWSPEDSWDVAQARNADASKPHFRGSMSTKDQEDAPVQALDDKFAREAALASQFLSTMPGAQAPADAPQETYAVDTKDDTTGFADQVSEWDAATTSDPTTVAHAAPAAAQQQLMPPDQEQKAMAIPATPATPAVAAPPEAASVVVANAVPVASQGDRAAQQHMLKTVHEEMEDSSPLGGGGAGNQAAQGAPGSGAATQQKVSEQTMPPTEKAAGSGAGDPGAEESGEDADDADDADDDEDVAPTAADIAAVTCDNVAACEKEVQQHVRAAGTAMSKASAAADKGDETSEKKWKKEVEIEKSAAVATTIKARSIAEGVGENEAQKSAQKKLAKAQSKEADQKRAEAETRQFAKTVNSESATKSRQRLVDLHKAANDAEEKAQRLEEQAKKHQRTAVKAESKAADTATVQNREKARDTRLTANRAFGEAHEARQKATKKAADADQLGATIEANHQAQQKDAACQEGYHMGMHLCALAYKSTSDTCAHPVTDGVDSEFTATCMKKAEENREACHALGRKKKLHCRELAHQQVYGDEVPGYELQITASMSVEDYSPDADTHLRAKVADRLGVSEQDVVTLAVKNAEKLIITLGVAAEEAPLAGKVSALMSAMSGGQPVGGIIATAAASRYVKAMKLPGAKPKKWVSEKAEKTWRAAQAETRKLAGMPSSADAKEVNMKAHTHELRSKKELAKTRTKEAELKKESAEMQTKVATKKALKDQELRIQAAEEDANNAAQTAHGPGGSVTSMSGIGNPAAGGGEGDFTVIRARWWRKYSSWLQGRYPGLHRTLDEAKKLGDKVGDQKWKEFLMNWFYTKMRESSGYRYTWNADGSYNAARHLVIACRRYIRTEMIQGDKWEVGPTTPAGDCKSSHATNIFSVSIRSVNNLCYPGVSTADARRYLPQGGGAYDQVDTRKKSCTVTTPVSVRLHRFRLVKPKRLEASGLQSGTNGAPAMYTVRAYRAVTPADYHTKIAAFADRENEGVVGVHRVKWSLNMVAEYCDDPLEDGTATPYDETKSWPRKLHETGKMKWTPINVNDRQEHGSDMMLTVLNLQTEDKRLNVICRTPQAAGVVNGKFLTPTDTKCDIKVSHWHYSLTCPPGKARGLALQTSVMTRYDDNTNVDNGDSNKVGTGSGRMTMDFQKQASLRVLQPNGSWKNRGFVLVRMHVSEPHWVPSTQFMSHRHYSFSFGIKEVDMAQVQNSELLWDPQVTSNFQPPETKHVVDVTPVEKSLHKQPKITLMSFLGLSAAPVETEETEKPGIFCLWGALC